MRKDLVDFIALHFNVPNFKMVDDIRNTVVDADANDSNATEIVTYENTILTVKSQAVRMPLVKN